MRRTVLCAPVRLVGRGVHSGALCAATVEPGRGGLRFRVADTWIPARVDSVVDTSMSTALAAGSARVGMVEHLLSALHGLGVADADVHVDGPELPILDGSALPWVEALRGAGLAEGAPVQPLAPSTPVTVGDGLRTAAFAPGPERRVVVELSARGGLDALGPRRVAFDFGDYAGEVAWARTFVHGEDVAALLAAGRGAGATPENTVVVPGVDDLPPPTRGPSEPSRHKLLDALGDLALLGRPLLGTVTLRDAGHALHIALVRRLAAG